MVFITPHSYTDWNAKKRPFECDFVAKEGDIVVDVGGVWCCCERHNDTNFLYVFAENFSWKTPQYILLFVWYLRERCGVEYIQLWSTLGRYDTFKKRYNGVSRRQIAPDGTERELYAFHITQEYADEILANFGDSRQFGGISGI